MTTYWDVLPDGKRFMVAVIPEETAKPLALLSNGTAALKTK
jgi:hypothetical protein